VYRVEVILARSLVETGESGTPLNRYGNARISFQMLLGKKRILERVTSIHQGVTIEPGKEASPS